MIHHSDRDKSVGVASKPRDQNLQHPLSCVGVASHPGRVENLGHEVAAEETPGRAIGARTDVSLVTIHDSTGRTRLRTVGENGSVLHQGLVGEGVLGDEDGRARADSESEDWAVLGV